MHKLLEKHIVTKLIQKELETMKSTIPTEDIESMIKNLPTK